MPSMHTTVWCSGDISVKNKLFLHIAVFFLAVLHFCGTAGASEVPETGYSYLILSEDGSLAVQVEDAGRENLSGIVLSPVHGGAGQNWIFKPAGPQYPQSAYSLFSRKSGKVLDVRGYSRADGADVQLFKYYGTRNQKWILAAEGEYVRVVSLNSGKCLDAGPAPLRENRNIRQYSCRTGGRQLWKLKKNPRGEKIFTIISKKSGKALDVSGNSRADGANIEMFRFHGRDNQLWTLWHHGFQDGEPTYAVISYHSGKALDVEAKSRRDRANIQQFGYRAQDHQHWKMEKEEGGFVRIISVSSGKCLEVQGGSTRDGANIQQFRCKKGDHQLWKLTEASPHSRIFPVP